MPNINVAVSAQHAAAAAQLLTERCNTIVARISTASLKAPSACNGCKPAMRASTGNWMKPRNF